MNRLHALVLLTFVLSDFSLARSLPDGAAKAIQRVCPRATIGDDSAIGDLNGDKISDVAVIVGCTDPRDQEIIVLLGKDGGSFRIAERTPAWPAHDRRWDRVRIKNGILIYSQGCAASCSEPWTTDFKFKMRHGQFFLIGEEHTFYGDPRNSPTTGLIEHGFEFRQSINYLSQEVIYRRASRTRSIEKRLLFSLAPIKLLEFTIDSDYRKPRELRGYIDETFTLKFFDGN